MKKKKIPVYQLTFMALMTAVMCILGPISLPVGPVPVSLMTMVIYLAVYVLGMWAGTGSCCLYVLMGLIGLPVFTGYTGGLSKLAGPTGGYIIGYCFMALIGGMILEKTHRKLVPALLGWGVATVVEYAFGTVWYMALTHNSLGYALAICVVPFLAGDAVKIVAGTMLGKAVRTALIRSGIIRNRQAAPVPARAEQRD